MSARCVICADVDSPPESARSSSGWSGTDRQMNAARRPATSGGVSVAASVARRPVLDHEQEARRQQDAAHDRLHRPVGVHHLADVRVQRPQRRLGVGVQRAVERAPGDLHQVGLRRRPRRKRRSPTRSRSGTRSRRTPTPRRTCSPRCSSADSGRLDVGDEAADLLVRRKTAGGGEIDRLAEQIADGVLVLEAGDAPKRRRPDLVLRARACTRRSPAAPAPEAEGRRRRPRRRFPTSPPPPVPVDDAPTLPPHAEASARHNTSPSRP